MKKFYIVLAIIAGVIILTANSVIDKMAAAIQSFEGWYPGSHSYRNNNPGNLVFAHQIGSTGADSSGKAIFPDYASGLAALKRQLAAAFSGISKFYKPSMTLYEFFNIYANGENSIPYAQSVATALGVSANDTLASLLVSKG